MATVGYGDYTPQNDDERILAIFIMLVGVAMFAYVMGSFTGLITSYDKQMGVVDKGSELQNWLSLLSKFSKGEKIDADLVSKIDKHFLYFWENNRNCTISLNDPFMSELPIQYRKNVLSYLWGDIFSQFWNFLLYYKPNNEKYFDFYYELAFLLMPRKYDNFIKKDFLKMK